MISKYKNFLSNLEHIKIEKLLSNTSYDNYLHIRSLEHAYNLTFTYDELTKIINDLNK